MLSQERSMQTGRATQRPARRGLHLAWRGREKHGEVDAQSREVGSSSSKLDHIYAPISSKISTNLNPRHMLSHPKILKLMSIKDSISQIYSSEKLIISHVTHPHLCMQNAIRLCGKR
jgi:hypothetical protein